MAAPAVVLLALALRTYNLAADGQNPYYAAGVRSMLDSWHNFFYVSFDPSGALSIDKPPLGFWAQVGAAKLLGFHPWVLALPQAIAGTLAVGVLYMLVRRRWGRLPALLSSLALAVMPASVASARNNSLDTVTMLLMLLAAWAALRAADTGRIRWIVAVAILAGLAFNTKMFAAFVPLPAFLLAYLVGRSWHRQFRPFLIFAGVLTVVSLSWVTAVGLTPAADRPYVYNGYGNNIWALTFIFNGTNRLIEKVPQSNLRATGGYTEAPPNLGEASGTPRDPLRLLHGALGTQIGWFLPLALVGAVYLLRRRPRAPDDMLWSAWLVTGGVLFSLARDAKPQYLEAFTPAVAVCATAGLLQLAASCRRRPLALAGFPLALGVFAASLLWTVDETWLLAVIVVMAAALEAVVLLAGVPRNPRVVGVLLAGALPLVWLGPLSWSIATAAEPQTGSAARYPMGGPDDLRDFPPAPGGDFPNPVTATSENGVDPVLAFLQAHTQGTTYLVLTATALFDNAPRYILATNRPVLTLDSFDDQATAEESLSRLVAAGRLRYMELPAAGPWSDSTLALGQWFQRQCVDITSAALTPIGGPHLYDCQPGAA